MDKDTLKSSFGKWASPLYCVEIQKQFEELKRDKYVKKLSTWSHFLLMLHAQLHQRKGLRGIAFDAMNEEFQRMLGLNSISASQLSRKNNQVDPEIFAAIFFSLVQQIKQNESRQTNWKQDLKIIDSSTISLCLTKYKWAEFRSTKAGIKVNLRLSIVNETTALPEKMVMSTARSHDRVPMDKLIDEEKVMYVFDRAYVDYEKFDYYCDNGIFFASRLKKNAVIRQLDEFETPEKSSVQSDSLVVIGSTQKRMENPLRLIKIIDSEGKDILIITNRFDLSADEISAIYRSRWEIELFFKWAKQHLNIKKFYGTSEKAVTNQVYIALIAYCLHVLVQYKTETTYSLWEIHQRLVSVLWQKGDSWLSHLRCKSTSSSRGQPVAK